MPHPPPLPRLLLTGFGPFPGAPRNPTERVVARIAEHSAGGRLGFTIVPHVFPTTWGAIAGLAGLVAETRPDVVLHLGLKRRATAITVEAFGRNRVRAAAADADGRAAAGGPLDADGPPRRPVTIPVRRMAMRVAGLGLPVEISEDAGHYLCNGLLWRSLSLAGARPTGFLHLPPTRDLAGFGRVPRLAVTDLVRAVEAAIGALPR